MEIIGIIAVLLLLFSKGGMSGTSLPSISASSDAPPLPTGLPISQQQFNFTDAQLNKDVGAAEQIGTQAATSIGKSLESAGTISSSFATAIPIVGAAISTVVNILLGQHTARLKGAIAENQLIPACVTAYDNDITEIVSAYKAGKATAAQCISALNQVNTSLYSYMKSNATGPGRSWRECGSADGCGCNSGCTAECCIYWGNLYAGIFGSKQASDNNATGLIDALSSGHGRAYIPKVYPPAAKYGTFSRAAYFVTV